MVWFIESLFTEQADYFKISSVWIVSFFNILSVALWSFKKEISPLGRVGMKVLGLVLLHMEEEFIYSNLSKRSW